MNPSKLSKLSNVVDDLLQKHQRENDDLVADALRELREIEEQARLKAKDIARRHLGKKRDILKQNLQQARDSGQALQTGLAAKLQDVKFIESSVSEVELLISRLQEQLQDAETRLSKLKESRNQAHEEAAMMRSQLDEVSKVIQRLQASMASNEEAFVRDVVTLGSQALVNRLEATPAEPSSQQPANDQSHGCSESFATDQEGDVTAPEAEEECENPFEFPDSGGASSSASSYHSIPVAPQTPIESKLIQKRQKTSAYRGVSFKQRDGRFQAEILVSGKRKSLGYFQNEVDAAKAYDKAAVELRGSSTRTNFTPQETICGRPKF